MLDIALEILYNVDSADSHKNRRFKMTYTAYKIEIDSVTLSNKEHLDNLDEVNTWLTIHLFNNVLIVQDTTGKVRRMYRSENDIYVRSV